MYSSKNIEIKYCKVMNREWSDIRPIHSQMQPSYLHEESAKIEYSQFKDNIGMNVLFYICTFLLGKSCTKHVAWLGCSVGPPSF